MAQDPMLLDQLQIEPGSAGTRLIRMAADGSLEFVDALVTGGITVMQLAGLKSMQNVLVVGKAGAGAGYNTIQAALDLIPASSSPSNPYYVLVGPGQYRETINIARNGIYIIGFGAVLQSLEEANPDGPGAYHTVVIQAALGTTPQLVVLQNLEITNVHATYAAVRVVGGAASTVGSEGINLVDCKLAANSAVGNHPLWATASNIIRLQGGSMSDPNGLGLTVIEECSEVTLSGVLTPAPISCRWVTTNPVPLQAHVGHFINACPRLGVGTSLSPLVALTTSAAPNEGNLVMSGVAEDVTPISIEITNGTAKLVGCSVGSVLCTGGEVSLEYTHVASMLTASSGTIGRERTFGIEAFAGVATKTVTFTAEAPSANYNVMLETDGGPTNPGPWIESKTATGFEIHFAGVETLAVNWTAQHND